MTQAPQQNQCQCVRTERCRRSLDDQKTGAGAIDERYLNLFFVVIGEFRALFKFKVHYWFLKLSYRQTKTCSVSEICCLPENILDSPNSPSGNTQIEESSMGCGIRNFNISNRIVGFDRKFVRNTGSYEKIKREGKLYKEILHN